ncbi:hypothetical protein J6590_030744 [Homalodisca vitripennis]|nr:hypothetical protein J6590_030744 [Homalodisca vitripennis]
MSDRSGTPQGVDVGSGEFGEGADEGAEPRASRRDGTRRGRRTDRFFWLQHDPRRFSYTDSASFDFVTPDLEAAVMDTAAVYSLHYTDCNLLSYRKKEWFHKTGGITPSDLFSEEKEGIFSDRCVFFVRYE